MRRKYQGLRKLRRCKIISPSTEEGEAQEGNQEDDGNEVRFKRRWWRRCIRVDGREGNIEIKESDDDGNLGESR